MNEAKIEIIDILNKIKFSEPTRIELNFLISKSYQISISFLKSKFASKLDFLSGDQQGIEEIAMDAIVPFFVKNSNNTYGLHRSLEKWDDPIETNADASYFLSRIIWRRIDQAVTKILKERDPIFEKIIKTLHVCIKNNKYIKFRHFGTLYILQNSNYEIDGQVIDDDNFNLIPIEFFGLKQTKLFTQIFQYIENETNFCKAIPLNLLVKRIKFYHTDLSEGSYEGHSITSDKYSLDMVVEEAMVSVREKLDTYYVSKNKLSTGEADLMYASFSNIAKDMLNGGLHDSLYEYLKDHDNSLTKELFYVKYYNRMNYLLSLFKNQLVDNIDY